MGRSDNIPDSYGSHRRPDDPNIAEAIANSFACCLGAVVCPLPILFCAYFIIGFFDQKLPDVQAFKTFWYWTIAIGTVLGAWFQFDNYGGRRRALEAYEQGYRDWQAEADLKRQEADREDARAVERTRRAKLELQREMKERARRERLSELENQVLQAQARHAVTTDFYGADNPAARLVEFRQYLARLNISDLGLLRESRLPAILSIVGDGKSLPPAPPPGTPFKDPSMTMREYLLLNDNSA